MSPAPGALRLTRPAIKAPDLGRSFILHRPVQDLLAESLPITLLLNAISFPIVYTLNDRNPGFSHDTSITFSYKLAFKSAEHSVGMSAAAGVWRASSGRMRATRPAAAARRKSLRQHRDNRVEVCALQRPVRPRTPDGREQLVFAVLATGELRGELLRRYPDALIYAVPALGPTTLGEGEKIPRIEHPRYMTPTSTRSRK